MLFSVKLIFVLLFAIASVVSFVVARTRWKFALQMIFGRKRVKRFTSKRPFAATMYAFGVIFGIIALLILF